MQDENGALTCRAGIRASASARRITPARSVVAIGRSSHSLRAAKLQYDEPLNITLTDGVEE
jgi:hypothetical protein